MIRLFLFLCILFIGACSQQDQKTEQPVNATPVSPSAGNVKSVDNYEFVVFVYHRFGDTRHISTNISLNDFRQQLDYLKNAGFDVVTLSEAINTKGTPGQKRAVISVDDSYKSFLTGAMPILAEYNFPVTLFVNTSTVGGDDFLTWSQLDSLSGLGIEIGNHSHSHAYFLDMEPEIYADSFRADVLHAQKLFRENLDMEPQVFAYPFGEYDEIMKDIILDLGFSAAMAQNSGVVLFGQNMFSLPRFPVSDAYADLESFKDKANARAFHVEYESPQSPVYSDKTPVWKLMTTEKLQRGRIQCFVQGGFCRMDSSGDTLIIQSESALDSRRVLYTITTPDSDGNWYWRSHVWINSSRSEDAIPAMQSE